MSFNSVLGESYNKLIKKLLWLYIILWIFEGFIRKWIFPGLSNFFLIARDPLIIIIYVIAIQKRIPFFNGYVLFAMANTMICFGITLITGHQNLIVALYGARIFILHFPLVFIFQNVFSREDVEKVGRFLLFLIIPMFLLVALQFFTPQSSIFNRGVGGDISGAGFSGVMGYNRPSGTFSFTSGLNGFIKMVIVFAIYFFISKKARKWLVYLGGISLLITLPLLISRAAILSLILSFIFLFLIFLTHSRKIKQILNYFFFGLFTVLVFSQFEFFQIATNTITYRFEAAAKVEGEIIEGTIMNRFIGGFSRPFLNLDKIPLIGDNLGMASNVGAKLIKGKRAFLLAEGEWPNLMGERGILLGVSLIIMRALLLVSIILRIAKKYFNHDVTLQTLLLSQTLLILLSGNTLQPSSLGVFVVSTGLLLASLNFSTQRE